MGKSTCARLWASDRRGAVVVEIDALRTAIPGWKDDEASKLEARRMATKRIDQHLRSGAEVMVPQFLGRPAFIDELERTAHAAGADFIEVRLTADEDRIVERFRARRTAGGDHPEHEIDDVPVAVAEAVALLADLARERPSPTVAAHGDPEATVALVAVELDR